MPELLNILPGLPVARDGERLRVAGENTGRKGMAFLARVLGRPHRSQGVHLNSSVSSMAHQRPVVKEISRG